MRFWLMAVPPQMAVYDCLAWRYRDNCHNEGKHIKLATLSTRAGSKQLRKLDVESTPDIKIQVARHYG